MWASPKLATADFDHQLESRDGVETVVLRGLICPCVNLETRSPNENCTSCRGWGYSYPAALAINNLKVQWLGHHMSVDYEKQGVFTPGTIHVTWPSTTKLGHGDIFVHPHEEAVETSAILVKGQTDPDGDSLERLRFSRVTGVDHVKDLARTYVEGVDFQLGADGNSISWIDGGQSPSAGSVYSVRYRYRAQYIIDGDAPQERHDNGPLCWHATVSRFNGINRQGGDVLGHDE
tara:strand:- start:12407 stop:13105 length:699 start_codon:yes stop_codon:yes gene_type:complete